MANPITKSTSAKTQIRDWLTSDGLKAQIAQALPAVCKPERFMRVLATSLQRTPKLLNCSQSSLFQAFITCSALGIEPDGRRAHLIPYGSECQLIIDYKGLLELVKRSGDVSVVYAEKVCANDAFVWKDGDVSHTIDFKSDRGAPYAYYARAVLKDGSVQSCVMTVDEVNAIRRRSLAANKGPWVTDFDEMAKKTVFRRLTKWLVLSPEVSEALDAADRTEFPAIGEQKAEASRSVDEIIAAAAVADAEIVEPDDAAAAAPSSDSAKNGEPSKETTEK